MNNFPCAKINLGLNIVSRRTDGYHNLETVFYPVNLTDTLEIKQVSFSANANKCHLTLKGATLDCNPADNLVVKAYKLLDSRFQLPPVEAVLEKRIPSQAGLGGGSSDAAFMITLLNKQFDLNIPVIQMQQLAATIGADCAFFVKPEASYATGIGEVLTPLPFLQQTLSNKYIVIVKPPMAISTREAFSHIIPNKPEVCCRDAVSCPISEWKHLLKNDFEASLFPSHPELAKIKDMLYEHGAVYAQMSGSGSSLFGIFEDKPKQISKLFNNCFVHICRL